MDGIYVKGKRPTSKKAIREAVSADPDSVVVESTSMFGGFGGHLTAAPIGTEVNFVGPDPYRDRRFYGTITVTAKGITVK